MSVYIHNMEMPTSCAKCKLFGEYGCPFMGAVGYALTRGERNEDCPLIPVPPHGKLIDADALVADLKRQCKEVFKTDAVSPDDFWITRNEAYNEQLWTTWCEALFDYLKAAPTIIPADKEGAG